jgi:hypothetical protein
MPTTPTAVLAELDPIRMVSLGLLSVVVTPLALLAREGNGDSDISASHGPSEGRGGRAKNDPARREVAVILATLV